MSGSKKKMARKELEQGTKANQSEVQVKSKAKLYWGIGIVAVIIVIALLIWDTGIFYKNSPAIAVGDTEYSIAEVSYYYNQLLSYEAQMAMYGYSNYSSSYSPSEQIYDSTTGQTYEDYFMEATIDSLTYMTAMLDLAEEAGYTLSEDGYADIEESQAYIDSAAAQYGMTRANYLTQTYGDFMTESVLEEVLYNAVLASDFYTSYEASLVYEDSDYEAYYDTYVSENEADIAVYTFRTFYISGYLDSTLSDEEIEALMAEALVETERAVEIIEAGDDKEVAFMDAVTELADETTLAYYEDDDTYSVYGDYTGTELVDAVSYSDWLKDDSRVFGDVTYTESVMGYTVVLYMGREVPSDPTVNIRHILIGAELDQEDDATTEDIDESTVPTQASLDAAYEQAAALLAQWENGEATAETFGALAELYSTDTGSNTNGGAYTYVEEGTMFDAFDAWINDDSRQSGDVTLIENPQSGQYGWHVVYFEDYAGPTWEADAQTALLSSDMTAWLEEVMGVYEVTEGAGMQYVG